MIAVVFFGVLFAFVLGVVVARVAMGPPPK